MYTEKVKQAVYKYRNEHIEQVRENDAQRKWAKYHEDKEYRERKLAQMKEYRERKKEETTSKSLSDKQGTEENASLLP
jgi:hypothetical protein